MIATTMLRKARHLLGQETTGDRLAEAFTRPDRSSLVRSGVAAGAAILALSAASAATSAIRRRVEGS
jgi:hypothetical protein